MGRHSLPVLSLPLVILCGYGIFKVKCRDCPPSNIRETAPPLRTCAVVRWTEMDWCDDDRDRVKYWNGDCYPEGTWTHTCRLDNWIIADYKCRWTVHVTVIRCKGMSRSFPDGHRSCDGDEYNMYGSTCSHSCNAGYKLTVPSTVTCQDNGVWSGPVPNCFEMCSWQNSHCWPGDCTDELAQNCVCRPGFRRIYGSSARCELAEPPDLNTCRVSVTDNRGNVKNSRYIGSETNCDSHRDEFIRTQPAELYFAIKADLDLAINLVSSASFQYVKQSGVGIVDARIVLLKVDLSGRDIEVKRVQLTGTPYCQANVSSIRPVLKGSVHDCEGTIPVPTVSLRDGESLCADMAASSGGYYNLQDESKVPRGRQTYLPVPKSKRVCFTYDTTKPAHCSQTNSICSSENMLNLSTRLTRTPEVRVHIEGWVDPIPSGGNYKSASGIDKYRLEVHGVDITGTRLSVQDNARSDHTIEWPANPSVTGGPFDHVVTLPEEHGTRLYAVILEVHDKAGNVAYVRRLVLYDNTSTVELFPTASLQVSTANPRTKLRWQTDVSRNVCVDWRDRFYNSELRSNNFLQAVKPDNGREIHGQYDQVSGILPVSGTHNVRGVVRFEISWSRDFGLRTPLEKIANVFAQTTCLREPRADGETYHVSIRATDIIGNYREDSVRVSIDHTGPSVNVVGLRGRFGQDGLYVHNTTDLSTMLLLVNADDPHSGLMTLQWTLGTRDLADDVGRGAVGVQRLANTTDCKGTSDCYCPSVGDCEILKYRIHFTNLVHNNSHEGDHHRQYYITITATNHASLVTRQTIEILLDESPPSTGVVMEGLRDNVQAEMDFTSSRLVRVHWHDFLDHESGVLMYRVVLGPRCLTGQEMDNAHNAAKVDGVQTTASFQFPSEGHYIATVVAYNGAMQPSGVSCSDGITYDTSPPRLLNVSLTHARTGYHVACTQPDQPWLVNANVTRVRLARTEDCLKLCSQNSSALDAGHLSISSNHTIEADASADFCRRLPVMTEDSPIVLPSDYVKLTWAAIDKESEMEEYYVGVGADRTTGPAPDLLPFTPTHGHPSYHARHSGLGHGDLFYIFLRAVSKAGLDVQVTLGPIIIDVTPPDVTQSMPARVEGGYLVVTWNKSAFVDLEQPDGVGFDITFRVGYDNTFITPFLAISGSVLSACLNNNHTADARYPVSALYAHDTEAGRSFFLQLHVTNAAGHVTTVNTSSVQLPAHFPPSHAVIFDVVKPESLPHNEISASRDNETSADLRKFAQIPEDVDVVVDAGEMCMAWRGLHHEQQVSIEVGMGTSPTQDDLVRFTTVENQSPACINTTTLPVYSQLYSVVRVTSPGGSAVFSSDGFRLIPRDDPENRLAVFNGKGCSTADIVGSQVIAPGVDTLDLTATTSVSIHPGDLVFVSFTPSIPRVMFSDAVLLQTTLTGYQLVPRASRLTAILPAPANTNVTVEIMTCLKDTAILPMPDSFVTVTWELSGPWTSLAKRLRVEVTDYTCQQASQKKEKYSHQYCLLDQVSASPIQSQAHIRAHNVIQDHLYVASVAICLDNACLPAVSSDPVTFSTTQQAVVFHNVTIVTQSSQAIEVDVNAAVSHYPSSFSPQTACVFLWTVARDRYAAHPVASWSVENFTLCTSINVHLLKNYTGVGQGTLYACLQPVFPWRSESPTCHKFVRLGSVVDLVPWHVIELPHTVYRENDFQQYMYSEQLGSKLHELYDYDIDFARSQVMLSAVVTYSEGRNVTWFLMTNQHVPADGECAGDADCVTSVSEKKGSVVFPRADSKLQDGHVYYICARLSHTQTDLLNSDYTHLTTSDVCGDGVVIDDSPPDGGSVTIGNAPSGYLADNTRVTVVWSGFSDVETRVAALVDSVILNYSVALGSYPGGEDLSHYVSVGQRTSWSFEHLNIATGATCIATVRAEDRVGHVTEVWSGPAILDSTPPTVGRVAAGTITRENYVAGTDLPVQWEGVGDTESGVKSLEVAISTEGGQDDIIPFANCIGNMAEITDTSALVDGHSYVVLIKVTNGAGLTTLMSSTPFIVDSSVPGPGQVWNSAPNTMDHGTFSTDVGTYRVYWSGFTDPHSGLDYYRVGLGSRPEQTDIHPFVYVGQQTSYTWRREFEQGKRYYVTVEVCNKAGLCRLTSSNSMTFDDSPPTPGHVTVGVDGHHSKYLGHNSSLPVQWNGFSDPQTGIQDFSWCVGIAPGKCDVMSLTMTSLSRAAVRAGLTLPVATPLYVTVRARNPAGLVTVSVSESFEVDPSPPEVVVIPRFLSPLDGNPAVSQWDRSVLYLAWRFEDPDSAVVSHTINIRSNLTGRLVVDPVIVGADTELTLALDADHLLADGDSHYAAVTACNAAGLCTMSVSALLLIDSTPPVVGTLLSPLVWRKISVTDAVKYTTDSDAAESTIVTRTDDVSTENSKQLSTSSFNTDSETSTRYSKTVSTRFNTDNTSAVTSATLSWDLSSENGSTVNPTTQSTKGLNIDISTVNSTIPLTEESPTDVTSSVSPTVLLDVMWQRFADAESGVAAYYVTAGRAYNGEELSRGWVRAKHDVSSNVQRHTLTLSDVLRPGDVIYLSVWAENTLGRHSAVARMAFDVLQDDENGTSGTVVAVRHSCDVAFCTQECTCAATGQVCKQTTDPCQPHVPDHPHLGNFRVFPYMGLASGPETFTTSVKCLEGHWEVSNPQLRANVWRFEWSFSLANKTEGDGVFNTQTEAVWHDVGRNTSAVHCMPGQRVLLSGQSYILHVRAWLSAQDHVTFLSAPIMADHTAPQIRRGRAVVESDVTCGSDVDYVTTEPTVTACWDGVFRDAESDVTQYVVWVGTSPYADDHTQKIPVGLSTMWTFPTASLQQGTRHYVTVRAVNGAGLITTTVSDGITVDVTPPVTGVVFASHRYSHLPAQTSTTSLPASWHGFQDAHSGLASYHVAIYDVTDNMTAVTLFRDAGIQTEFTMDGLNLEHNHRYAVLVKATDKAGLESQPVESRAILIDITPAEGVTCNDYQLQEERTLAYTSTSSFLHDSYITDFSLHVADIEELVQIQMMGSNMQPGAAGYLAMEEKKMPVYFKYAQSGVATAQHVFMASGEGKQTISVEVQARPGAQIQARLYRCNDTAVSQEHSITVHQMSQFDVSVCARIRDKESGIRSLLVGVGTTPGGLQVRPLTPVGQSGHSVVQVHLQHGLPVYATVHAENHAGQWSRFISQPITMDRTPPQVSEVKVTLRYEGESQDNAPEVWGEARWSAEDAESGVVSCTCGLEGQSSIQPAVQKTSHVTPGFCQWRLRHPQHEASVRATVSCVNGVQIHATVTSDPAMVLLQPPDLAQASVVSLSNHAVVSPFHQSDLGVRSSNSSLHFCWHGVHDPTITGVQFRFLHESRLLTEWSPVDVYKTSITLERGADKLPTGNVTAQVRAANAKSMTSDPVFITVQLDDREPTMTGRAASATLTDDVLGLTWQGVFTTSSDVIFVIYAGTAEGYGDVINHVITQATSYSGPCTKALSSVHVTIKAMRANGMSAIYQAELKL